MKKPDTCHYVKTAETILHHYVLEVPNASGIMNMYKVRKLHSAIVAIVRIHRRQVIEYLVGH